MKRLLIILLLSIISLSTYSTHLMGGEITYTCIKNGPNEGYYVFNVVIYRDCQGIPIDTTTFLNVHNNPLLQTITLNYIESNDISPSCNTLDGSNMMYSCGGSNQGSAGNGAGAVEEHVYRSDTIRILGVPDQDGWHFTWSDCCRNGAIINITNPNNYGFTLRTAMYPYTDSSGVVWPNNNNCYDNSPVFYEKPRTIIETYNGYDSVSIFNGFTYSHNAYDIELDSISYEFAPPLDETGYDYLNPNSTSIPFSAPYSYTSPISSIVINQNTGRTSYPANLQGNYVTCTKVSSFRCGQLISEVFREIQVIITPPVCNLGDTTNGKIGADTLCNVRPHVQAPFYYPNLNPQYQWDTMIHCGDTISFDFIANDYDFYPNGSRQDLLFEVSGGQFYDYINNQPCVNPPCATFEELSTGVTPPFVSSGGQGGGRFNWITDCNQLTNGCSFQGPNIFNFVIKVTDDFCPAPAIENTSQVISILVFPPCINLKTGVTTIDATCNLNDGIATSNPFGGTPPYVKYWTDINGIIVNPDSLYAGTYLLRVTDSTLCETIDTFTIHGPTSLNLTSNITDVSCNGGNDGSIDISSNILLSYSWSTGDTTQDLYSLTSSIYSLNVTDVFGCSTNQTFVISEPGLMSVQNTVSNVTCYGFNDASINISANGGTAPYQYLWNTGDTSQSLVNIGVGVFSFSVIDQNSCIIIDSFQVYQPNILINNINATSVSCNGLNNGDIITNPSGGTPPYFFLWNTNDTTQSLFNVGAGNYTVNIIDSNNCSLVDSVLIMQPDSLVSNILLDTTSLTASVVGGVSPYFYEFYGPSGWILSTTNSSGGPISINLNTPGYYSFVVVDANNCVDSVSIYYGNNFSPTVNVTLSNVYCDSLSDLTISVSQ
ncbi:SprB repeat-containing protein, partial [Flavobacteriales bacterium]|nr:SprB repeat-containing protein [Flavobacteriales bacterium]